MLERETSPLNVVPELCLLAALAKSFSPANSVWSQAEEVPQSCPLMWYLVLLWTWQNSEVVRSEGAQIDNLTVWVFSPNLNAVQNDCTDCHRKIFSKTVACSCTQSRCMFRPNLRYSCHSWRYESCNGCGQVWCGSTQLHIGIANPHLQ